MKISFLEDYLLVNGSIRHIIEMANDLVRRNHEVTIYSLDHKCDWLKCDAKIRPQGEVLHGKHDALIFNNANTAQWQLMEKSSACQKLFYLVGMGDSPKSRRIVRNWLLHGTGKVKNNTLKRCFQSDDYTVIVNSTWLHTFVTGELGLETHIVLSGVNADMFYPVYESRTNKPSVMISGDPRSRYETDIIHKAVELAKGAIPELSTIQYFGKGIAQSKMSSYICQGWLFADAQNRAGWNNPVAEAMACGVPVVCTDIGGNRDFAIHNETALIVPVGNAEAMSEAIIELVQNRVKAEKLSTKALKRIKRYTWQRSVDQLMGVLNAA